jgi:RecG-like helicase
MGKNSMKLVKPKLQALCITDKSEIDGYIKDVYEGIVDKNSLKFLPSFILFICCVVEEVYSKRSVHHAKINKRDEVLQHVNTFLDSQLTEADKQVIISIIEDLHSSKRIKKVSIVQKLAFTIGSFFLKNN